MQQEAKPKSTEAAQAQGLWIPANLSCYDPCLQREKHTRLQHSFLPPAAAKLLMVVLSRYADRPVLTTLQRQGTEVSSCTWKKRGGKTQPEIKLGFIMPALRLPLTAWLPICSEHTHASHGFCDFTGGSCTDTGQGISRDPALELGYSFFFFFL